MVIIGGLILAVAIIVIGAILNGWVLSILWGWFMVPVFTLPELAIAPAIGIALVISYLTKQQTDTSGLSTAQTIGYNFGGPFIVLLFGWIVKSFM